MDTAREYVVTVLGTILPKTWTLYPYYDNHATPSPGRVVGQLLLIDVKPNPENPLGSHLVRFTLELSTTYTDPERREDDLDDNLDDLLYAIQVASRLGGSMRWTNASRAISDDRTALTFNIDLEVITEAPYEPLKPELKD